MRFAIHCIIVGLSITLTFVATASNQQPQGQQRPRTVGQSNANNSQNTNSEEVDEGDVLRVETQLVSVPTVVTDRNGRPVTGLRLDDWESPG